MERSGFVAFCGCPNTGKSTLLNRVSGQKVAAVSDKPQTTRFNILGIVERNGGQMVMIDTPGLTPFVSDSTAASSDSKQFLKKEGGGLNQLLRKNAHSAMKGADVIVCLIDISQKNQDSYMRMLEHLIQYEQKSSHTVPIYVAFNKIDQVKPHNLIQRCQLFEKYSDSVQSFFMISALNGDGVDAFIDQIMQALPEQDWIYPEGLPIDSYRVASEITMEQVFQQLNQEVPYRIYVETLQIDEITVEETGEGLGENKKPVLIVHQNIIVSRENYKAIVIGEKGQRLRRVGQVARYRMKQRFLQPVRLYLRVKVIPDWETKKSSLIEAGFLESGGSGF